MAKTMRLTMWCALVGAALKACLLVGWRLSGSVTVFRLLTSYDPVSFWLADNGVRVIFSDRRIAPSGVESLTFELLLVVGFSLQCVVLGSMVQWLLRRLQHDRRTGVGVEPPRV